MCSCSSCTVTDTYAGFQDLFGKAPRNDGGFSTWPKGEPAGPRVSKAEYSAHVAHSRVVEAIRDIPDALLTIHPEPRYPHIPGLVGPLPSPSTLVRDWIASSYAMADSRNVFHGPSVQAVRKSTRPLLALAQQLRKAA